MSIEWGISLYPVNKFENNKWTFNKDLEDKELIEETSLSAYALFKFLLFTNLIYSVEEIKIKSIILTEKIKYKLYYLINKWRNLHRTPYNLFKNIYPYYFPNLQLNNNKDDIACNFKKHILKWILEKSYKNKLRISKQMFIGINNQKYKSELEELLKYFSKIKHTNSNRKLVYTIFNYFDFNIVFYYYQDSLFDLSIHLDDKLYSKNIIKKEKFINSKAPLNSSILSKTLEKGSQLKEIIFLKTAYYDYVIKDPVIHISFSANALTIDWSRINPYNHLKYLKILFELWPELILRLKNLKDWNRKTLDFIQRLLIYCEGSPHCWKISFSKVVINIDIDKIRSIEFFIKLNRIKHLYNSLSKTYDVEFENVTYEDLFFNGSYFKEFIERRRDDYNNQKLKYEKALKYTRIESYLDNFLNNTNDGINQTIAELKLKEFEFYADKINMDRYD